MTTDYRLSHLSPAKGQEYDASFYRSNYKGMVMQWEKAVFAKLLEEHAFHQALDFACGTGRISRLLEGKVDALLGVDVSDSMLAVARKRSPSVTFLQHDLTREPLARQEQFDLITAFRFFTNAQTSLREEVFQVLTEMLKPGGSLVFNLHMNTRSAYATLARVREMLFGKREGFNHLSLSRIEQSYLRPLDLEVVSVAGFGIIPVIREEKVLPRWHLSLLSVLERFLALLPGSKWMCKYQIVHCRKRA